MISPVETRRFEFPLFESVAAGKPIEAVEYIDVIEVPPTIVGSGDHFVLEVNGGQTPIISQPPAILSKV